LFMVSAFLLVIAGAVVLIMPALRESTEEWKRTLALLRGIEAAPRLGFGRAASRSAIERFIKRVEGLEAMSSEERDTLAAQTLISQAQPGTLVVYRGETSNMAYFILKGSVGVGYIREDEYVILNYLHAGEFFGEMAALTGSLRTANVITEEESEFLVIPARVLRKLARHYTGIGAMFQAVMTERLRMIDLPTTGFDQELLRELRTNKPDMETESASA